MDAWSAWGSTSDWTSASVNVLTYLQSRPGQRLRVRFTNVNNQGVIQFAVDNVQLWIGGVSLLHFNVQSHRSLS